MGSYSLHTVFAYLKLSTPSIISPTPHPLPAARLPAVCPAIYAVHRHFSSIPMSTWDPDPPRLSYHIYLTHAHPIDMVW